MLSPKRQLKYWLYTWVPGFAGRFPYYGTPVHFRPGAAIFRAICENGGFEPDIVNRIVRLARPDTTVFDVGANIGLMAIPVLRACPSCRVVSFEPSPNSLPFLERTVAGSGFADRWTVVGKGLAGRTGEMDFAVGRPQDALFEGFSGNRNVAGRSIRVPVSTLDDEWRRLGSPDVSVIKIDVEGAEGMVLAGGRELLAGARPAVVIEWHEPYLTRMATPAGELVTVAREHRYRIFTIPAGTPVDDELQLRVQMIDCQNFLLMPEAVR